MHDSVGLRERKKAETRKAIADVALALAVERGPAAVTVDDIAAAAGVSPRTVFNYFVTKEAAILNIDPDRRRLLVEAVDARPAGEPPLEALRAAMRETTGDGAVAWRTRARLAREHLQLHASYVASFTALEDDLTAAVARRVGTDPAADPYPRLVVTIALTTLRVAVDHALATGKASDSALTTAIDQAFDSVARGLARSD